MKTKLNKRSSDEEEGIPALYFKNISLIVYYISMSRSRSYWFLYQVKDS